MDDQKIIHNLELLIKAIKEKNMPDEVKERLSNFLEGNSGSVDPEMMKYLFTGWWIYHEAARVKKEKANCDYCYGFGLWDMGDNVPMGRMDASEGMPTLPCPKCGKSANPRENRK